MESEWRIVGTRGSVRWDGADSFQAEAVGEVGGFFDDECRGPTAGCRRCQGGWTCRRHPRLRELRTPGAIPETSALDNIKSLAMVFGAIKSAAATQDRDQLDGDPVERSATDAKISRPSNNIGWPGILFCGRVP